MKKRTTEESRAYMRRYRARQRGVTPAEQGVTPPDKTSHKTSSDMSNRDQPKPTPEEYRAFKMQEYEKIRPAFLVAPDDDCAACGHDRQQWHLEGKCQFRDWLQDGRCGCPAFVAVVEPF